LVRVAETIRYESSPARHSRKPLISFLRQDSVQDEDENFAEWTLEAPYWRSAPYGLQSPTIEARCSGVLPQNGNIHGVRTTETTRATSAKGVPTRTKSMKVYFPGPTTSVFTGEDTGVMNAAEAASATVIANG
jgi:hypothetical protein